MARRRRSASAELGSESVVGEGMSVLAERGMQGWTDVLEQDWNVQFVGTVCGSCPTVATAPSLRADRSRFEGRGVLVEGGRSSSFLTASATAPMVRSPSWTRFLSPPIAPSVRIFRNGHSFEIMPLPSRPQRRVQHARGGPASSRLRSVEIRAGSTVDRSR